MQVHTEGGTDTSPGSYLGAFLKAKVTEGYLDWKATKCSYKSVLKYGRNRYKVAFSTRTILQYYMQQVTEVKMTIVYIYFFSFLFQA